MSETVRAADRPEGAELLALARKTLLEELLPALPEDRQLAARMVANAMAIAARELERSTPPDLGVLETLAQSLRTGRHDAEAAVHAQLLAWAERRVAVSNPRALAKGA